MAGDVTPAGPIGLPAALSLRAARIRLSPARGGRGAWACAAVWRPPAGPLLSHPLEPLSPGRPRGLGLLPTPLTGFGGVLRRGRGRGSLAPIGRGPRPPPPAPGRCAAPGKLLVCGRAAGPPLGDPQPGLPGPQWPEGLPGALACARPPSPPLPAAPPRSSLLPVSLPPPASTRRPATSASGAGRPSRPPAGRPARRPRPPSFVVR